MCCVASTRLVTPEQDCADVGSYLQAVAYAIVGGGSLVFIRPRVPVQTPGPPQPRRTLMTTIFRTLRGPSAINTDFLARSTFYAFIGNNVLSSMANFLPAVYIPCWCFDMPGICSLLTDGFGATVAAYAHDLGMTKPDGTVLLALMNGKSSWKDPSYVLAQRSTTSCSGLYSRLVAARLPLGQNQSSTRHLPFVLRYRTLVSTPLGLRYQYRRTPRVCDHVWLTRIKLFGTVDQAYHRDCS
jgi:hypothetical protein